jgi:DNA-binding NtrC family response regulator
MIQKHKALKAHLESYQDQLIGISSSMSSVRSQVENCRSTSFNVLISGESGTGKKLVSKNIIQHHLEQELAVLDCRSSTTEEHEVILFGYAAGSFTGADSSTDGLMSKANNGILAIYEIDNLSLTAQTKLLKAIESGEYYPLGSSIPIKSSCRIISTTNKNLQQLANNGLFNASLLQLLNTFQINLEPLRERLEDIPSLSQSILLKVAGIKYYLRSETIDYLKTLSWKRNVMELKIFLDYAYIQAIANDRFDIRIHDFYSKLWKQPKTNLPTSKAQVCKKHYSKAINSTEKRYLKTALRLFENNIPQLSNALEISKPTIYTRLKIHQLFHKT